MSRGFGLKYCGTKTMNTGQYIPITVLVVLTLTLIEAAGAAEYRKLPGIDQKQQFSAKIMQVCNRLIKNYTSLTSILCRVKKKSNLQNDLFKGGRKIVISLTVTFNR